VAIIFRCECGKEFLTRDEESGRCMTCPGCQRELIVPRPTLIPQDDFASFHDFGSARTSGKAIASFVLGLCSYVTCFLTGVPAILVGIRALNDINNPKNQLSGRGFAILGIVLGSLGSLLAVALLPGLLTAFTQPGHAPRRAQCMNYLKMIALAMHDYEKANGCFPPAAVFDKNGKALLSWRVLILPYLEQDDLYIQFHLDEAWDSPHNKPLADQAPGIFRCPSEVMPKGLTTYKIIVDPHSMFTGQPAGVRLEAVIDGTPNTLLVVEGTSPVFWSKPEDLSLTSNNSLLNMGSKHPGGFNAASVDGAVQFIQISIDPRLLKGLVTRDGNETVTIPR
jgi:hypothetical protein